MKYKPLALFLILLLLAPVVQAKAKTVHTVIATDKGNPFLNAISDFIDWLPSIKTKLAELNNKANYSATYDHLGLIAADLQRISDAKSDLKDIIADTNEDKKEIKKKIDYIFSELNLLKSDLVGINDYLNQSNHPESSKWMSQITTGINLKLKDMKQFQLYLLGNNGKLDQEEAQLDKMKDLIAEAIKNINSLKAEIAPLK